MTKVPVSNALISIRPMHVENIISGRKTVELRRRPVILETGAVLWIYSTLPAGRVEAVALVEKVISDSPDGIWSRYKNEICISQEEFHNYFAGSDLCFAIFIRSAVRLETELRLSELKKKFAGFHPPQFMKKLCERDALLKLFLSSVPSEFVFS